MSSDSYIAPVKVTEISDMGPGNEGTLGPSEQETAALKDLDDERYYGPFESDSGCMDDRLEGLLIRLAGNRAVTEVIASYMDAVSEAAPQSRAFARKVSELVTMGRVPNFHEKCAALASQREALRYAGRHEEEVIDASWDKLTKLSLDSLISREQLSDSVRTGLARAEDESLWDADADELMRIAKESGAVIEGTPGEHHVAGNLDNMSDQAFDNGLFRNGHKADDGEPLGLLNVSWAGYRNQLIEDGYSEADAARVIMRAVIFNVSVQKLINRDGSPLVTVGQDS